MSIYLPGYLGFRKEYGRLAFSRATRWDEFAAVFPMRSLPEAKPVLLAGISHRTRADREELAAIRVADEFRRTERLWDGARHWRPLLEKVGVAFQVVDRPREYGFDWRDLLAETSFPLVVVDSLETGPDRSALLAHLERGGNVLITTPAATASRWDDPLYRDVLRIDYGGPENERRTLALGGPSPATAAHPVKNGKVPPPADAPKKIALELVPARPGEDVMTFSLLEGAEPFLVLDDGRVVGVKVARQVPGSAKRFKAIVLGFQLTDLKDVAMQEEVLRAALDHLKP
mgnify:CR=1 FL=1